MNTDVEEAFDNLDLDEEVKSKVEKDFVNLQREDNSNTYGTLIYYHAQQEGQPRTKKLIAEALDLDGNDFYGRAYGIADKLDLNLKPVLPESLVDYLCDEVGVSDGTREDTRKIIENLPKTKFSGKTPRSLIAGAIHIARYLNDESSSTQKELCSKTMITDVTLRNIYNEMLEEMDMGEIFSESSEEIKEGMSYMR